ncbi:TFIID-31kDa-domain-containing protein [Viridothelium virens]|uniref:TFIID-31kDa-domain-containing protein n=1 Tax=Viridothelium virens TaxID=1048519 RepID=A0A6A6H6Y0_VIRVR|nr:TFIID-31kDa-domain-containing protein [Viridothelium virens]
MSSPAADAPTTNGINGTSTPTIAGATTPPNPNSQTNGSNPPDATPDTHNAPPLAMPTTSLDDPGTSRRPRDARLIHLILANLGVNAYQERVPLMLLDFAYRYTSGVLSDAMHISAEAAPTGPGNPRGGAGGVGGAGSTEGGVTLDAVRQAIASRLNHQFNATLPKEFQLDLAAERNRVALPKPEKEFGLRLPPERYCLTGVGWQMKEERMQGMSLRRQWVGRKRIARCGMREWKL